MGTMKAESELTQQKLRLKYYKLESDKFINQITAMEWENNHSEADNLRAQWSDKKAEIRLRFPYNGE